MLNLFLLFQKNKKINNTKKSFIKSNEKIGKSVKSRMPRFFPSPLREWKNSIYVFNKNSLNLIPSITITVNNFIKSYFYLYNKRLEMKMRSKRLLRRLRRLSSSRYYVSNGEFKHTNNKVIINLYVFNRQKANYLLVLKQWYLKKFLSLSGKSLNVKLIQLFKTINNNGIKTIRTVNKEKHVLIQALNTVSKNKNYKYKNFRDLTRYTKNFYKKLTKKYLKKLRLYYYYKKLLYINKSKLNYTYLQYLNKYLEKIYNKNVEFNIINLKRFYLNSDIMSQSVTLKISRNRRKMFKYLTKFKDKIRIWRKRIFGNKTSKFRNLVILKKKLKENEDFTKQRHVIRKLKYRHVSGFRLQAKGRLTRRYTAARSVSRLKYKGNLLNIDSSYKGLSSVLLKGNLRSNTQYTKLNSKTRIGSFGIKGWVNGN